MIFSGRSSCYELAYCLVCIVLLILSFICQQVEGKCQPSEIVVWGGTDWLFVAGTRNPTWG